MLRRIGILGGSFDPIHNGHLAIAEEARVVMRLDQVLFIPAAYQPLKLHRPGADARHRLAMVQLACQGNQAFHASDVEILRPGPSFTVTTIEQLHAAGVGELSFILGADALADLPRWHNISRLIELARLIVVGRPHTRPDIDGLIRVLPALEGRLDLLEGPRLDLASSELRRRVSLGWPIRYLTSDAVVAYIEQHRLYRQPAGEASATAHE